MSLGSDTECDVLVVGSGSAGLAAALVTAAGGLSTLIVERTDQIGGTTAMSAAGVWVPANHHARAAGIDDSPDEALEYIRAAAPRGWQDTEDALWRRFVVEAPQMLAFVERHTPLRFATTDQPDPHGHLPGAKPRGRMISPAPLRRNIVDGYSSRLRPPDLPHIFTYQEALALDPYHRPVAAGLRLLPKLAWRWLTGARGMGTALVSGLLKGCIDLGCRIEVGTRAVNPILEGSAVRGALVECQGQVKTIRARRGVVLASGGFEWDRELLDRYFPGPRDFIASPPGNDGDAHRFATAAGAQLAHMDQANITPGIPLRREGRPGGMSIFFHLEPNAIAIDRNGQRFVNEFRFNIGEVLDARDPVSGRPVHLPAWLISDARFLSSSPVVRRFARCQPDWMVRENTLAELAERIGVPAPGLCETVLRYNRFCDRGVDEDFHRDETREPHGTTGAAGARPNLVSISKPPFVAMPFNRSFVSTKGGPRTNEFAQVLRADGSMISGLFCAGVAMANPFGTWAVGIGTTLGPTLTWGYIAGKSLLESDVWDAPSERDQPTTAPVEAGGSDR